MTTGLPPGAATRTRQFHWHLQKIPGCFVMDAPDDRNVHQLYGEPAGEGE
jgi:hypothetical protein